MKEFAAGADNAELFLEESEAQSAAMAQQQWQYQASVPGLLNPNDVDDPDL